MDAGCGMRDAGCGEEGRAREERCVARLAPGTFLHSRLPPPASRLPPPASRLSTLRIGNTIYLAASAAHGPRKGFNPLSSRRFITFYFLAHAADYGRHERARPFPGKEGTLCQKRPTSLRPRCRLCRLRPTSNG